MNIAFHGYGTMGAPIIGHLVAHGHAVRVVTRSAAPPPGTTVFATPAEAASDADIIFSCVPDDAASSSVWFGDTGALAGAARGAVAIELSTLSVAHVDRWALRIADAGIVPVDAPLTGSLSGARDGTLTAFVGGGAARAELSEVLAVFCARRIDFGTVGNGMRFKLAYNLIAAQIGAAFVEGVGLAERLGLSPQDCVEALATTGWTARVASAWGPSVISDRSDDRPVAFKARYMHKDLTYALRAGDAAGASTTLGRAVADLYGDMVADGRGDQDFSAVGHVIGRRG